MMNDPEYYECPKCGVNGFTAVNGRAKYCTSCAIYDEVNIEVVYKTPAFQRRSGYNLSDEELGKLVRRMLPNTALYAHNDGRWTYRMDVMDVPHERMSPYSVNFRSDSATPEGALVTGSLKDS